MTIVETTCSVTAGVDTHADVHVAAVVDQVGGVLGVESFPTTEAGCQQLIDWLRSPRRREPGRCGGHRLVWGRADPPVGAGRDRGGRGRSPEPAGASPARASPTRSTPWSRPGRRCRVRRSGSPKSRSGDVEAIRVLMVARRSAASERIAALNQLRHLCFTADHQVRRRFERLSVGQLTAQAAALRPRPSDTVRYSTLLAMRTLARRVAYLDDELDNLAVVIRPLVERTAPRAAGDARCRLRRRRQVARRRRRQPRSAALRSRLRPPLRRRPAGGVLGQDPPPPTQPWRRPPSQQRPLPRRDHPHVVPPGRPRPTSPGAAPKANRPVRSCASSSATSPAKPSNTSAPTSR